MNGDPVRLVQIIRNLLMVEDDLGAGDGMAMLLELLGHEVRVVHDGIAALDEARRTPPDVVLIDIGLPKLDGYEVAGQMRLVPGMHRAVLVALTGYGTSQDIERAVVAGFQHFLTKPVALERVEALLAKIGTCSPVALVANAVARDIAITSVDLGHPESFSYRRHPTSPPAQSQS